MGRQHVENGRIRVRQQKTRRTNPTILIPIHPNLQRELDQAPMEMTFLITQQGKPFSPAGFTNWFRERAMLAGVRERTPHGLRKAAGRRLAEAGCTAHQVAAILGHRTLSEVSRYTQSVDQMLLADQAMSKLQAEA